MPFQRYYVMKLSDVQVSEISRQVSDKKEIINLRNIVFI